MKLKDLFRQSATADLSAERNVVNPATNSPKRIYSDLFFEETDAYRRDLRGGRDGNGNTCFFTRDSSMLTSNAIKSVGGKWVLAAEAANLQPKLTTAGLILVIGTLIVKLGNNINGRNGLNEEATAVLWEWAALLKFAEENKTRTDRMTIATLVGHCESLDQKIESWLEADASTGSEEVLIIFEDGFAEDKVFTETIARVLKPDDILTILNNTGIIDLAGEAEAARLELVTQLAASLTQNLLIIGPPGTGKTYLVHRSIENFPIIQVSLEGSTEPETVVANIAQTPDGKFKAFLAETAKALKLGMLLAIVERLRQGRVVNIIEGEEINFSDILKKLPKGSRVAELIPAAGKQSKISSDLKLILDSIAASFDDLPTLKAWLAVLDNFADPFDLDRWEEVLFVYQNLEAHAVGTTCVLNIEEIYHAVENRKILDLLINLMAGQKKLPLSKAGVVGGELYGHNISVFATGNPITDSYLPQALESRFGLKEFMGYPDDVEEKRRMKGSIENFQHPPALATNLLSTKLEDYSGAIPLPRRSLGEISDDLREKIYSLVQWTRSMYSNQELRNCACPRTSMMWELLTAAFMAEGKTEKDALMLAVKSTAVALVSIDHQGEPDPEGLKNIFGQAESYFLT